MFNRKKPNISQAERKQFCENIIESSAPKFDFYFLVLLSTLIVSFGLAQDNIILVLGGMLVTPILSPVLAVSLGIVILNFKFVARSVRILVLSFLLAVFVSFIVGMYFDVEVVDIKLIRMMHPSVEILLVAFIAGIAASYTWAKQSLNSTLPGIAITVTLIPPLTAIGLALANKDWEILREVSSSLYLNIFGIIVSSMFVFYMLDFKKAEKKVISEVKEEEKELNK